MTLFGKSRLNENSVVPLRFETWAMFFNRTEMRCKSVSKSFQNIVNALSNTDKAFNETATGRLESFIALLLLVTMKSLQQNNC